jgi:quinol monooxygenase YgiN
VITQNFNQIKGEDNMPTGQPYAVGHYLVKSGKESAFKSLWENMARETVKHYRITGPVRLLQNPDNPRQYLSYGEWVRPEDIKDWLQQPYYKDFVKQARELCDTVERNTYNVTTDVPIKAPEFEKAKAGKK